MRALVTGAKGQLGHATVSAMLADGHRVAALDIGFDATVEDGDLLESGIDLRDSDSVEQAIRIASSWLGGIDVLVNAAGIIVRKPLLDTDDETFASVVDTNLVGAFRVTRRVAEVMRQQRSGSIVHIVSIHALQGVPLRSAYAASKGGIAALVRVAAAELGPLGITVNALAPGPIGEGMGGVAASRQAMLDATPVQRVGQPQDVVDAVLFLTSERARFITGQIIPIDGGMSATIFRAPGSGRQ